ncbi:MAG: glycosyltransferase family 2 protein [Deltaproteobacteria bacterium]|nr:glycosyltransferase family 2 protein [Deltaproteobacteria bacterium]
MMGRISFIICNFNALPYFRFCYESLRRNLGAHHEVILLDDGSSDGSRQWMESVDDPLVVKHFEPENIGIAYAYNKAVSLASSDDICMLHTDMYIPKNFDRQMLAGRESLDFLCAFRVEPPVYPPSPDKTIYDFGDRLETFDENGFLHWAASNNRDQSGQIFQALFFPWMTSRNLFLKIGGVDHLFLKYMADDDDLYIRVKLAGARVGQIRDTSVYHFCSKSTKFSNNKNDREWMNQYMKSQRNFIRKWGIKSENCWDEHMGIHPPHKYDVGLVLRNADMNLLEWAEPWFDTVYVDNPSLIEEYIDFEQPKTLLDLKKRVQCLSVARPVHDVTLYADAKTLDSHSKTLMMNVPKILDICPGPGRYRLGTMALTVRSLRHREHELVLNPRGIH